MDTLEHAQPDGRSARMGRMVGALLELHGWQRQHFAETVGMKAASLSNKIGGSRPWQTDELDRVAAALGVPVSLLWQDPDEVLAVLTTPGRSINYRSA